MSLYARIYDGEVAELFRSADDITTLFNPSLVWVDVTNVSPAPQVGWNAAQESSGWRFAAPTVANVSLVVQALSALDSSDRVVLRCYENAVPLPAAWVTYRKALRAIANGSDTVSTALPTQPAYPAGT